MTTRIPRTRFLRALGFALGFALATALWIPSLGLSIALAQQPARIKNGDVLSGELLAMRSRAKGKRVVTFQLTAGPYRLPDPAGLCNLEGGPQTFQLVTHSDAEVNQLKGFAGKTISVKANEVACSEAAGQVSDALITKWSVVKAN